MRSEFLGECARLPGLAAVVNTAQYLLPRMDTASMRRAIRRPAELYGGSVTIELADRLVADGQGSPDEMPLIQHGLMRKWELAGEAAAGPASLRSAWAAGAAARRACGGHRSRRGAGRVRPPRGREFVPRAKRHQCRRTCNPAAANRAEPNGRHRRRAWAPHIDS